MTPILAGVGLGLLYTLSPSLVICVVALWPVIRWASRGLSPDERRWFTAVIAVAIVVRLAIIAGLFLTADAARPYGVFFGDEELFKSRSVWFRNVALGVPISPADFIYAFDDVGRSGYLYALAYLQALIGDAPYGLHLLNAALYLAGVLALYRLARAAYWAMPAMAALILLLFLPSLFLWSISALKEPAYILAAAAHVICVVQAVRASTLTGRTAAVAGAVASAIILGSLRTGGTWLALAGTVAGLALAWALQTPRRLIACLAATPVVGLLLLSQPVVQDRLLLVIRQAAMQHRGHVSTPGNTYKLLDPWLYREERAAVMELKPAEAGRYVVRAISAYLVVPMPWQLEFRSTLLYWPEHMVWYAVVVLVPFGVLAGMRRDVLLTSLLISQASVLAFTVAVASGNIGTLIRHRGLALPYLIWLAALGGGDVIRRLIPATPTPERRPGVALEGERAW